MTIAIDCRMLEASGVGVYLKGCLSCFLKTDFNFILIGDSSKLQPYLENTNNTIIQCTIKPFSLKELFNFPKSIVNQINKANLYFSPFFNIPTGIKIPVFTTIHDIVFLDLPNLTSKLGLFIRKLFFFRAYKKSAKIFTVSEYSKSRIMHHLGRQKPVIVTYSAPQSMFFDYRKKNINAIQKKDTIVFIGNIKRHKGINCLLDAFYLLKKSGFPHKLIIIGSKEKLRTSDSTVLDKIKLLGDDSVLFTGFISDDQLMDYISTASLLVQPSLYEGFCLPPLESMILGTNVLISDIPVLQEIYSDYPVSFFKAGNVDDLKEKMIQLLSTGISTPELSENQLYKYSFEKTSSIMINEFVGSK